MHFEKLRLNILFSKVSYTNLPQIFARLYFFNNKNCRVTTKDAFIEEFPFKIMNIVKVCALQSCSRVLTLKMHETV